MSQISKLEKILRSTLPNHEFADICSYLFLNPGKLFRSKLIQSFSTDFKLTDQSKLNSELLEAFIETHHTYTLIHDDLPSMDNDDTRRGLESTHIKFGEANAILSGDALILSSFHILSKIQSSHLSNLLRLVSWATGPKGLINGQFLDLKSHKKKFEEILRIHELKTSRLFQICSLGTYFIKQENQDLDYSMFKDFLRIGSYIGILFQLLDDYKDRHEKGAEFNNLFYLDAPRAKKSIEFYSSHLDKLLDQYQLNTVKSQINDYTKSVDVST